LGLDVGSSVQGRRLCNYLSFNLKSFVGWEAFESRTVEDVFCSFSEQLFRISGKSRPFPDNPAVYLYTWPGKRSWRHMFTILHSRISFHDHQNMQTKLVWNKKKCKISVINQHKCRILHTKNHKTSKILNPVEFRSE